MTSPTDFNLFIDFEGASWISTEDFWDFCGDINLEQCLEVVKELALPDTLFDSQPDFRHSRLEQYGLNDFSLPPEPEGMAANLSCQSISDGSDFVFVTSRSLPPSSTTMDVPTTSPPVKPTGQRITTSIQPAVEQQRLENSMSVFNVETGFSKPPRRRKRFNRRRRQEIASMRGIGVCLQCKFHKEGCGLGVPCGRCVKRAGSIVLGQQLCSRQSLAAARFDNTDLLRVTALREQLNSGRRPPIAGTETEIFLSYPSCEHRNGLDLAKSYKINHFTPDIGIHEPCSSGPKQLVLRRSHIICHEVIIPDFYYAFLDGAMPTLDDLIECSIKEIDFCSYCCSGPFHRVQRAFLEFGEKYCELGSDIPLKSLMNKIIRLNALFILFRRAANMRFHQDDLDLHIVSSWMSLQLRYLIGQGLLTLEAEVLKKVDEVLFVKGVGRQNPLATWTCLWLLILTYKEHMSFIYFHYLYDIQNFNSLFGQAKHIYNTLTSIYAALFKTTSPLTFDWRTEEISEMLGSDSDLVSLFCNIKTEMLWFHGEKECLFSEDILFKTLVIENEVKLVGAHIKEAKRRGFL